MPWIRLLSDPGARLPAGATSTPLGDGRYDVTGDTAVYALGSLPHEAVGGSDTPPPIELEVAPDLLADARAASTDRERADALVALLDDSDARRPVLVVEVPTGRTP